MKIIEQHKKMNKDLFNSSDIVEALSTRLWLNLLVQAECSGLIDDKLESLAIIREFTEAIFQITAYKLEVCKDGNCCNTCFYYNPYRLTGEGCKNCNHRNHNWQPRITKATFGFIED